MGDWDCDGRLGRGEGFAIVEPVGAGAAVVAAARSVPLGPVLAVAGVEGSRSEVEEQPTTAAAARATASSLIIVIMASSRQTSTPTTHVFPL